MSCFSRLLGCAAIALALALSQAHAAGDPPGRVAHLNYFNGTVIFSPAGSDDWAYIPVNRPLTTGDRLWVEQGARSELHIGSSALRLGSKTSVGFTRIDSNVAQLNLAQGTLSLRVRSLPAGQAYEIDTPNIAFSVRQPGEYRINVAPDGSTTTVIVHRGSGTCYGDEKSLVLDGEQQISFTGTGLDEVSGSGYPEEDSFDQWVASRDRADEESTSARYVSREVIGYGQLDGYGTWRQTPQYGMVWVPYHTGRWAWIQPWGWTWIDDAPWGFAPYHYGRWAYLDHVWCWVPGTVRVVHPVYAPALVAFIGGGSDGVHWSASFGNVVTPAIGWFPLGPGEIFRPAYRASPRYVTNINRTVNIHQTTINNITVNNVTKTVYANQARPNAITAVPVQAFVRGQAVEPVAQSLNVTHAHTTPAPSAIPAVKPTAASVLGGAAPVARPPALAAKRHRETATPATSHERQSPLFTGEAKAQADHGAAIGPGHVTSGSSAPRAMAGANHPQVSGNGQSVLHPSHGALAPQRGEVQVNPSVAQGVRVPRPPSIVRPEEFHHAAPPNTANRHHQPDMPSGAPPGYRAPQNGEASHALRMRHNEPPVLPHVAPPRPTIADEHARAAPAPQPQQLHDTHPQSHSNKHVIDQAHENNAHRPETH